MSPEWTQDLSAGVEEIDSQHKELFSRINNLHDAMKGGKGKEEIKKLIFFLDDYVAIHFKTEEKYMTVYDYPDYLSHKSEHTWFKQEFADIKSELEKEGPGLVLILRSNKLLSEWFIKHIMNVDKVFGAFLKSKL